jgi:hypothetical protein
MDTESLFFFDKEEQINEFPYSNRHKDKKFWESEFWICIIKESEELILGYCSNEFYNSDEFMELDINEEDDQILDKWSQVSSPIPSNKFITSNTPIIDAVFLFHNVNDYFLVMDKSDVVGILSFYDLDCNEMRVSIFSIILELDSLLDKLIIKFDLHIEKILGEEQILSIINKYKLNEIEKKRSIIHYLNIYNKLILLRDALLENRVFESNNALERFGGKVLNLRNKIAHGDTLIGEELGEIIPLENEKKENKIAFQRVHVNIDKYEILSSPKSMQDFILKIRNVINKLNHLLT